LCFLQAENWVDKINCQGLKNVPAPKDFSRPGGKQGDRDKKKNIAIRGRQLNQKKKEKKQEKKR